MNCCHVVIDMYYPGDLLDSLRGGNSCSFETGVGKQLWGPCKKGN